MTKLKYLKLKNKWVDKHRRISESLWTKHKKHLNWLSENSKQLAVGSLGSLILISSPGAQNLNPNQTVKTEEQSLIDKSTFLITDLKNILPSEIRPLTSDEEASVSAVLSRDFNMNVRPEIEEKRLNRSYGLIGAEQHLARYPGDTMSSHFDSQEETSLYYSSGMAPGLGAWRYFANSKESMTEEENLREKYYIAVQTFLAKDFSQRFAEYRDFFRFRKMLLVNPDNGRAIVTAIGDAGPAAWTGKHLGGSPEVMSYLERYDGAQRGPVLYFFIDDPENKIPLGPVK